MKPKKVLVVAALFAAATYALLSVGVIGVVLNVHHPSDVLAGWALGFLYYLLCVTLVHPLTDEPRSRTQDSGLVSPG